MRCWLVLEIIWGYSSRNGNLYAFLNSSLKERCGSGNRKGSSSNYLLLIMARKMKFMVTQVHDERATLGLPTWEWALNKVTSKLSARQPDCRSQVNGVAMDYADIHLWLLLFLFFFLFYLLFFWNCWAWLKLAHGYFSPLFLLNLLLLFYFFFFMRWAYFSCILYL